MLIPLISEISENVYGIKMEAPQMFPPAFFESLTTYYIRGKCLAFVVNDATRIHL